MPLSFLRRDRQPAPQRSANRDSRETITAAELACIDALESARADIARAETALVSVAFEEAAGERERGKASGYASSVGDLSARLSLSIGRFYAAHPRAGMHHLSLLFSRRGTDAMNELSVAERWACAGECVRSAHARLNTLAGDDAQPEAIRTLAEERAEALDVLAMRFDAQRLHTAAEAARKAAEAEPGRRLVAPVYEDVDGPMVFLAGPIQGAADWQSDAAELLQGHNSRLHVANPRRSRLEKDFTDAKHGEQVDWETHYLRRSGERGVVVFWLAAQAEETPGRPYAQTTRFELGEWKERAARGECLLVVGVDAEFTNARYIRRRFAQDCPDVPVCDTLAETCAAAAELASGVR